MQRAALSSFAEETSTSYEEFEGSYEHDSVPQTYEHSSSNDLADRSWDEQVFGTVRDSFSLSAVDDDAWNEMHLDGEFSNVANENEPILNDHGDENFSRFILLFIYAISIFLCFYVIGRMIDWAMRRRANRGMRQVAEDRPNQSLKNLSPSQKNLNVKQTLFLQLTKLSMVRSCV